ncbi:DUF4177 domain-containing protein [Hymenobacter weizhouensis]|uniref:DUF4177 domain-containing protein n=1 Tax=Hymenobacter sp. YIM 151500-1 TaxID=2987689 RepID=UPI0022262A43|nr:DUF4177 domain-containing protein [Hymenobacter sp. YIM 151500-1]UYZ62840.1 DUF4177 domain-containing protein [Hymenobacter sp. YIM 151500-1]
MRFTFFLFLLLLLGGAHHSAQGQVRPLASAGIAYQYLQMTTIESIVAGGMGRSRILFTPQFKGNKEVNLENLFSLTGLNLQNVRSNEETILRYLAELDAEGWELVQATPLTQTLVSGGTTGQGLFMTRYLFRKAK